MPKKKVDKEKIQQIIVPTPHYEVMRFTIQGTAPYVQERVTAIAIGKIRGKQVKGDGISKSTKNLPPKDFDELFHQTQYLSPEGLNGLPSGAIKSGMIDCCRCIGAVMTHTKLAFWTLPDFHESRNFLPLFRIYGTPEKFEKPEKNSNGGLDIRVRTMFQEWHAKIRIKFDPRMFSKESVTNLLVEAGTRVGIGAGRPYSKNSNGCGWGTYEIVNK